MTDDVFTLAWWQIVISERGLWSDFRAGPNRSAANGSLPLRHFFEFEAKFSKPSQVTTTDMDKLRPAGQVRPTGTFILALRHLHKLKFSP